MFKNKSKPTSVTYLIVFWMLINIVLMLLMLPEDYMDLNNWIELGLWTLSIAGVLSKRKWGYAFAIFTLSYTLSTSVGIIIYYQIWLNGIRVIINIPIIAYLFKLVFGEKSN